MNKEAKAAQEAAWAAFEAEKKQAQEWAAQFFAAEAERQAARVQQQQQQTQSQEEIEAEIASWEDVERRES